MGISSRHILQQGPVIAALGRALLSALRQQVSGSTPRTVQTPGPELRLVLPPRPAELVRDYVRHVGGDPATYKEALPPHLFPQWGFGPAAHTLEGLPHPIHKGLNAGCRMEINAPLPSREPLHVRARLEEVDEGARRIVLKQRVVTGTESVPDGLVAYMFVIIPQASRPNGAGRKGDRPRVPRHVREVAFWHLSRGAGLDFAKLTGDFNPVHWVPAYARLFGFKSTILHGFSTMARAVEGLNRGLFAGAAPLSLFDVKFTRPLLLPARVGLYVDDHDGVYVGDAPGGPAYMTGRFATDREGGAGRA